ncbi:hypothetical protein [Brassicibacter mesophilus]|uniref:hypothetical protein n=1 Tax=Brassicibacter mesophilus TaxID=745119 RepID=UPI003D22574A
MNFEQGLNHIERIMKRAKEDEMVKSAWDMWLGHYNNPFIKKKIPWNKFVSQIKKPMSEESKLSKEDIIAKAEEIKKIHLKRR